MRRNTTDAARCSTDVVIVVVVVAVVIRVNDSVGVGKRSGNQINLFRPSRARCSGGGISSGSCSGGGGGVGGVGDCSICVSSAKRQVEPRQLNDSDVTTHAHANAAAHATADATVATVVTTSVVVDFSTVVVVVVVAVVASSSQRAFSSPHEAVRNVVYSLNKKIKKK
jgi:multisubunit Na+/H+ antiporter MnhC subunit